MHTLIIATSATPRGIEEEIRAGKIHRVDYLELGRLPGHGYLDYNHVSRSGLARRIEDLLRLDLRQAVQAAKIVRREGYTQVFSMSERVGIPLAMILDRRVRHVVQMAHGLSLPKLTSIQALGMARRWRQIIAPTEAEAQVMRQAFGAEAKRVHMLHYVIDTDFYNPANCPVVPAGEDHIESLGLSYRDYPTLVAAMRRLPQIRCYLRIGSTWYDYHTAVGRRKIPDNLAFKPYVHPAVLRECYLQSRFSVIPLRRTTQWSAGCTTVMQAQAMGRAVIATRTPGMEEYLQDGETGILVPPSDPEALAEAIQYLWENPRVAEEMGRRGEMRAREMFSFDKWMGVIARILCDGEPVS